MRLDHKAGSDYGIDYGVVAVVLMWLIATIALLVVLAIRVPAQNAALSMARSTVPANRCPQRDGAVELGRRASQSVG